MSVEGLQALSSGFLIASGILFIVAVALFFIFNVPKLISEVTGIAERKGVAAIRERSEHSETGSTKTKTEISGQLSENSVKTKPSDIDSVSPGTVKLATKKLVPFKETTVLNSMSATDDTEQNNQEYLLPVLNPNAVFTVIEEFSFTSSAEIIE